MYTKAELLNFYNMNLEDLLKESEKHLKDEVEFCSIIRVFKPSLAAFQAQLTPAVPPPTMIMSYLFIVIPFISYSASHIL